MVTNERSIGLETTIEKVGRSLADRFGIRVICRGNICCTDGKNIFLPSLPDELPEEVVSVIRGYIDHEAGHLLFRSNFRIAKWFRDKYGEDGLTFLNILEDLRVEEGMRCRFPGSKRNLECVYKRLAEEATATSPHHLMRQLAFGVCSRGNGYPDLPFVDAAVYETLDMIADAILRAPSCRNTKEVARLADSSWPIVRERLFPPPPNNPPSQHREQTLPSAIAPSAPGGAGHSHGEGESGATPAPSGGAAEDSGRENTGQHNGDGQPPSPGGNTENAGSPQVAPGTGSQSNTATHNPVATASTNGTGLSSGGVTEGLAETITRMVNRYSSGGQLYRVWDTEHDIVLTPRAAHGQAYHLRMAELLPHVAGVRQRLLQTLLAELKARWLGDREAGRINPRSLHRLAVTIREHQPARVFRERVKTKRLHTACTLIIDQSNSMKGRKLELAGQTALVFCEALSRLRIPCSVIGFSTRPRIANLQEIMRASGMNEDELQELYRLYPLIHVYYKHFTETLRNVATRFDHLTPQSWTPLGESIMFAARELARRGEERKVLFVMTDGRPLVGRGLEHAKTTIRRVEKAGVEVALVGIMEGCVEDLHHRSVVVNSLEELPKTVVRQLQSLLTSHRESI